MYHNFQHYCNFLGITYLQKKIIIFWTLCFGQIYRLVISYLGKCFLQIPNHTDRFQLYHHIFPDLNMCHHQDNQILPKEICIDNLNIFTEYDCPGGTDQGCSNQGSCNDTTGICICNSGFEGDSCHLSISKVIYSVIILKIYIYRSQLLTLSYS